MGNVGTPVSVAFRTDLNPPYITAQLIPTATNTTLIALFFTVRHARQHRGCCCSFCCFWLLLMMMMMMIVLLLLLLLLLLQLQIISL